MSYSIEDLAAHARKLGLKSLVLMGYDERGRFHFASSHGDGDEILRMLKNAQEYAEPGKATTPERRHTVAFPDPYWDERGKETQRQD